MSRGFVKGDDRVGASFIPLPAPLPTGARERMSPRGLQHMHAEGAASEGVWAGLTGQEGERRRAKVEIGGHWSLQRLAIGNIQ